MIVLDASVGVAALLGSVAARVVVAEELCHVPHLVDSEVASVLRRRVMSGAVDADAGWAALATWGRLGLVRHSVLPLAPRIWALRVNLSAYDAAYVALAEVLGCGLVTADARLARAPGITCPVTVLPRGADGAGGPCGGRAPRVGA